VLAEVDDENSNAMAAKAQRSALGCRVQASAQHNSTLAVRSRKLEERCEAGRVQSHDIAGHCWCQRDDLTAETLIQVLAQFGVAVDRSSAADVAVTRLAEEQFDQVIVDFDADFDGPETASLLLEGLPPPRPAPTAIRPLPLPCCTMPRRSAPSSARALILSLTRPVTREQAQNTLRAATALLKRERRQSFRVAVQAAGFDSLSTRAILWKASCST